MRGSLLVRALAPRAIVGAASASPPDDNPPRQSMAMAGYALLGVGALESLSGLYCLLFPTAALPGIGHGLVKAHRFVIRFDVSRHRLLELVHIGERGDRRGRTG